MFSVFARPLYLCLALLLLSASGQSAGAATDPIELNAVLSLTGQAAFIGNTYKNTLVAFENYTNAKGGIKGRPIHFVFADDQSTPQTSVQLVNALIAQKVTAFLGPNLAATCRAVAPLLTNGPVEYCLSPSVHPAKDSYIFSVGVDSRDQNSAVIDYLRERGWRDIAMLVTTDASGQDADASFAKVLAEPINHDVKLVALEHFNVTDQTVSAQLTRIEAARPQVIIGYATGTPMGTMLRGLLDTGNIVPFVMDNANIIAAEMHNYQSLLPKELYSYGPPYMASSGQPAGASTPVGQYLAALKAAGIESDYITGLVWDPASILTAALRNFGAAATAGQIRDFILSLHRYEGVAGLYNFGNGDQRGLGKSNVHLVHWMGSDLGWSAVNMR